jgi:hypothetical protein
MKQIYLPLAAILLGTSLFAQSQRLVLAEAFSNASCPPCASQNPNYNTLLNNNQGTVVSVKYQTNFPGVDPMNAHNPSEVDTRRAYYSVTGVPWGALDGTAFAGPNYSGALANLNQTAINNRAAITAPFSMNLTHSLDANLDSVTVNLDITCTENLDAGSNSVRLHILMVERDINFSSPPGTTNETYFKSVMRKMYPNANGETLASAWTAGQTYNVSFKVPVPNYIYLHSEIAFVAFIQNHTTRNVYQAGYSSPQTLTNYGEVASVNLNLTGINCNGEVPAATASIKNLGSVNMTSATINYQVNGMAAQTTPFTGNIAPGASQSVTLPAITGIPGGSRTLTVWLSDINNPGGSSTQKIGQKGAQFSVSGAPANTPFSEGFEGANMPANWIIQNTGSVGWSRVQGAGGFGSSTRCMRCFFWNMSAGTTADLFSSRYNFTSPGDNTELAFDVAYTYYSAGSPENDQLRVDYSTNCGSTWTNIFAKGGTTLSTAPPVSNSQQPFVPTASQWRTETIDVSSLAGQGEVLFRFRGVSAFGDNLYLDNVRLQQATTTSTDLISGNTLNIYPNPANEQTMLSFNLQESEMYSVKVFSITGALVLDLPMELYSAGTHTLPINTANLASGVYQIIVGHETERHTLRLVVTH